MFTALSRGIPSFGDLSWKAPADFATDPAGIWTFPAPVLSPAGAAVPGQTLTKVGNGTLTGEPPVVGFVPTVGMRLLLTSSGGTVGASDGLWTVVSVGSGASPWQLVRDTDADTPAELPDGTLVIVPEFAYEGGLFSGGYVFYAKAGGLWSILPNGMTAITVIDSAAIGLGAVDPALLVTGGTAGDRFLLDQGNRDIRLLRSAAKSLQVDDNGGGALTLLDLLTAPVKGKVPIVTSFTANGTWTPTANWQWAIVEAQGGGGAGGGAAATAAGQAANGGGGGGGGFVRKLIRRTDVSGTGAVVIGGAGAAPAAGANTGGAGGNTTFTMTGITTLTAGGGQGGVGQAAQTARSAVSGGAGGTATGGDINVPGEDGSNGQVIAGPESLAQNRGGNSMWGRGGMPPTSSGVGAAGTGKGGGGAGGTNNGSQVARAGAAGTAGQLVVYEFFGP